MDDDADVEDWKQNAENRDEENYQFLRSMKFQDYGFDPDGPMIDDTYGILCEARSEGRVVTLPLGELDDVKGNANRQLIADYCHWLHNFA